MASLFKGFNRKKGTANNANINDQCKKTKPKTTDLAPSADAKPQSGPCNTAPFTVIGNLEVYNIKVQQNFDMVSAG